MSANSGSRSATSTIEGSTDDHRAVPSRWPVDDVDSDYERLKPLVSDWVQEPTTMPRGNRSILFRDPDGNLVNLFAPVTQEAIKKFSR